jgi:hypothetical protein
MKTSHFSKVALAVAAAIGAAPGFALDLATTNDAATTKLVVTGASAARDAFLGFLSGEACVSGTLNVYRASPTSGQDFRVYSCTLIPTSTTATDLGALLGAAAGTNVAISYRSEGGSGWGPHAIVALALDPAFPGVYHLDTTQTGAFGAVTATNYSVGTAGANVSIPTQNATVVGYNLANDTFTSGPLVLKQTDLGIADTEPKMYTGTNYPTSTRFTQPEPAAVLGALKALDAKPAFGQVFGVLVNNTGGSTASLTNLSQAALTKIFSSPVAPNWSTLGQPAGSMPRARRENGSGTQVSAAAFFNNVGVGDAYTFITGALQTTTTAFTGTREFGATSTLEGAVGASANAISFNIFKSTAPANTKYISIDGVAPSRTNAANGTYKFAYELTLTQATGLSGAPATLATVFQDILQRAAYIPDAPSVYAIPGIPSSAPNAAGTTISGRPVAIGTRGANSSRPFRAP